MDSKVLESLMIPEYEIATEGLGGDIKTFFKSIGNKIIIILHKFIALIDKIINFIKNKGKNIHTDKETFLKAYRLSNEAYPLLLDNIRSTYVIVDLLSFSVFDIGIHATNAADYHDINIEHAEERYSKAVDKFNKLKSLIGNETIYFTKDFRDHLMKALVDGKMRFEKAEDRVRNLIRDELEKDVSVNNSDAQTKRANDYLNYLTKCSALFGEISNFINQHVSNDIITDKDILKNVP